LKQCHLLDAVCILPLLRVAAYHLQRKRPFIHLLSICEWHPINLSDWWVSNEFQDQAHTSGLLVISSHKMQLRCICRLWVFISMCKHKQYGTERMHPQHLTNLFKSWQNSPPPTPPPHPTPQNNNNANPSFRTWYEPSYFSLDTS
jgi:hypothetical protein